MPAIKPVSDLRNYNEVLKEVDRSGMIYLTRNEAVIYIVNIYDDREDFMYKLFGIHTISEETDPYWRE